MLVLGTSLSKFWDEREFRPRIRLKSLGQACTWDMFLNMFGAGALLWTGHPKVLRQALLEGLSVSGSALERFRKVLGSRLRICFIVLLAIYVRTRLSELPRHVHVL